MYVARGTGELGGSEFWPDTNAGASLSYLQSIGESVECEVDRDVYHASRRASRALKAD